MQVSYKQMVLLRDIRPVLKAQVLHPIIIIADSYVVDGLQSDWQF